ncbi:MAG: hypothetical protein IJ764_07690 [Bacteroidales bacterium]|nr:hypothetical protein [Bacteroidales bacterium]
MSTYRMFGRGLALFLIALLCATEVFSQTGLYIPSAKPVRNLKKALVNPEAFCLLIQYQEDQIDFTLDDLDLLDSVYRIAFSQTNPKLYTMMIEGYGNDIQELTKKRVDEVFRYFAQRSYAPFPIRIANNPVKCSCHGDTVEQLRYEVPVSLKVYDCSELPDSRLLLNNSISLKNSVLVSFHNNPAECIGMAGGCYLPSQDTTIRGYYTKMTMPKGAVYSVEGTKDSCPPALNITIEEHFDYEPLVERYSLVPHPKQFILHAGYVVLKSNFSRAFDECEQPLQDSIFLSVPITQEQWDNKLRVYGKKYTDKGPEYKMLTTKKVTNKSTQTLYLQVALNPTMFDTLYFGKRIKPDEVKAYLYPVDSDREEGVVQIKDKYYKAYKMNRKGEYESRKALKVLFRTEVEQEEEKDKKKAIDYEDDEEIKED